MLKLRMIGVCLVLLSVFACSKPNNSQTKATSIASSVLAEAEKRFALRDQKPEKLVEARDYMVRVLAESYATGQRPDSSQLQLAELYLRVLFFDGLRNGNRNAWQDGVTATESYLAPTVLDFESPVYYYFKALFLSYLSDTGTEYQALQYMKDIQMAINKGLEAPGGRDFEGGGLYRLRALYYSRDSYRGIAGAWDLSEARVAINKAIAAESYPGNADGILFCENLRLKAKLEKPVVSSASTALFLAHTLASFQSYRADGLLPEFIRAETNDCLAELDKDLNAESSLAQAVAPGYGSSVEIEHSVKVSFVVSSGSKTEMSLGVFCPPDTVRPGPFNLVKSEKLVYKPEMSGLSQEIRLQIRNDEIICPSYYVAVLDPGQLKLERADFDFKPIDMSQTPEKRYRRIKDERDSTRKNELIKITGLMANSAGSKEAMYCLIATYEPDPLASGVVEDLKLQYGKLFEIYKKGQMNCPIVAVGALAKARKVCQDNPNDLSLFCVVHARYVTSKAWYDNSLKELDDVLRRLDQTSVKLIADINGLMKDLNVDVDTSETLLKEQN